MSFGSIKNQKYVQVAKEVYTMALEYLLKTEFSGVDTPEKLADLTGMTTSNAKFLLKRIGMYQVGIKHFKEKWQIRKYQMSLKV